MKNISIHVNVLPTVRSRPVSGVVTGVRGLHRASGHGNISTLGDSPWESRDVLQSGRVGEREVGKALRKVDLSRVSRCFCWPECAHRAWDRCGKDRSESVRSWDRPPLGIYISPRSRPAREFHPARETRRFGESSYIVGRRAAPRTGEGRKGRVCEHRATSRVAYKSA